MEQNNNYKSRISPSVYLLIFIIAIIFEFYWIMTDPYDYFMLVGIGIIALIMGYLTFESIIVNYNRIQKERYDQNEMIIKTQKALYLATKKSTQTTELRAAQNIEAIKYMVNKMTDNQKELTTMFLTASEERAALTTSNSSANSLDSTNATSINTPTSNAGGSDIASLVAQLAESNNKLAKEVQAAVTVSELVKSNELLVNSVRNILEGRNEHNEVTIPVSNNEYVNTVEPIENIEPIENVDTLENVEPVVMESILEDTLDLEMNLDSMELPEEMPSEIEEFELPTLDNLADEAIADETIADKDESIAASPASSPDDFKVLSEEEIAALFANV